MPNGLLEIVEPLFPPQPERPQGAGTRQAEDRAVLIAVVYVLDHLLRLAASGRRTLPGLADQLPPGLTLRYECSACLFTASLSLACYKKRST